MNKNKKTIEDLRMDMIAHEYKTGESWENRFFKRSYYKKFERGIFFHYLDLLEEIRNAAQEDEEV